MIFNNNSSYLIDTIITFTAYYGINEATKKLGYKNKNSIQAAIKRHTIEHIIINNRIWIPQDAIVRKSNDVIMGINIQIDNYLGKPVLDKNGKPRTIVVIDWDNLVSLLPENKKTTITMVKYKPYNWKKGTHPTEIIFKDREYYFIFEQRPDIKENFFTTEFYKYENMDTPMYVPVNYWELEYENWVKFKELYNNSEKRAFNYLDIKD